MTPGEAGASPAVEGLHVFRASDLRQWFYCRRVVFYSYCKPVDVLATEPMEAGRRYQEYIERLERRRKAREYGLETAERVFDLALFSPRLGLAGRMDLVLKTPTEAIPVDFKQTTGTPRENQRIQLAAYGLLVEEAWSLPARRGFIFRIPDEALFEIPLDASLREAVICALAAMRHMVECEIFPEPPETIAKCLNCEFINFCNDRL